VNQVLNLNLFNDIQTYKNEVIPYLEQDEIVNNLALGLLLAVKEEQPIVMATVTRENNIVMALFQSHPKQIILSKAAEFTPKEIHQLAALLDGNLEDIPGLIGEKDLTNQLAKEITYLRKRIPNVQMNQRLYRLDNLEKKPTDNGRLKRMELVNLPLVKEWVYQFCIEINEPMSSEDAESKAKDLIERGRVYGWEVDGEIVSMANASRPTKTNITVNFVFTPLSERKKGYASSCVSAITELMLNSGYKTTSLYTDLDNPTSNKIYMEIGYKPLIDSIVIHFK
jgi:predicted GNAT family acetyltransferase